MTPLERQTLRLVLGNPYIPQRPTAKQLEFLARPEREVLFGGAAGGAKSSALLMAGLMFVNEPDYSGILFRKTFTDLALPDALMDRAHGWLASTDARWREQEKTWHFPSGATLTFGYLDGPRDKYRYQGAAFSFVGVDEATQIRSEDYLYLLSRLRRGESSRLPLRVRSATNPGGISHRFFYERFVVGEDPGKVFIPAKLSENPHLDTESYAANLRELDDVTRAQLLEGQWITDTSARPFDPEWWRGKNRFDPDDRAFVNRCYARWISFDTAEKIGESNAYTAAVVFELDQDYTLNIRHVERKRLRFPELTAEIERLAIVYNKDRKLRSILVEDKSSGVQAVQTLQRSAQRWLAALIQPIQVKGSKEERWNRAAVWCGRGCIALPHPKPSVPWLYPFEDELYSIPDADFVDQADAFAQGIQELEGIIATGWRARTEAS